MEILKMKRKTYYRMFEIRNGLPATLFHGIRGSRTLPLNQWIDAEIKQVRDGSSGKIYKSGFHILPKLEETIQFIKRMFIHLENRVIAPVSVDIDAGIWPKTHSRHDVFLAAKIRISNSQWAKRISLI